MPPYQYMYMGYGKNNEARVVSARIIEKLQSFQI